MTTVVVWAVSVMLGAAALLTVARIIRGPSVIDRAVATDVLVATLVVALGVEAGLRRDHLTLPILVSLALLGFVGSVAVARFVARDTDDPVDRARVEDADLADSAGGADPTATGDAGHPRDRRAAQATHPDGSTRSKADPGHAGESAPEGSR